MKTLKRRVASAVTLPTLVVVYKATLSSSLRSLRRWRKGSMVESEVNIPSGNLSETLKQSNHDFINGCFIEKHSTNDSTGADMCNGPETSVDGCHGRRNAKIYVCKKKYDAMYSYGVRNVNRKSRIVHTEMYQNVLFSLYYYTVNDTIIIYFILFR